MIKYAELDREAMMRAKRRWDRIAKPLNSLGLLEQAVIQIAGICGNDDVRIDKRCVLVFCGDHGVVEEGVTQTGSDVTAIVAADIAAGKANINRMAQIYKTDVIAVDMGMKTELAVSQENLHHMKKKRIASGTRNMTKEPAMTLKQAEQALIEGIELARERKTQGMQILVTGEMGIGNTTSASALASVILEKPVEFVTGRGAGLDRAGLDRKIDVIKRAIALHNPKKEEPMDLLAKLGGYEIAGMAGLFLGGAVHHIPVVIDGMISAVAACIAALLEPQSKEYMLASHVSKEPAGSLLLEFLGKKPLITAELCLGEGTGGVLLLPLLDGALSVYRNAHTFEELPMEKYEEFLI